MADFPEHGVLINLNAMGVFITGESGIGKTETALQLIHQGAILICDDAPEFTIDKDKIIGICPEGFYGLMHIRDIGIIDIRELLGKQYFNKEHKIDYIIELIQHQTQQLSQPNLTTTDVICHYQHKQSLLSIPGIKIHVSANRNIPLLVQIAIAQLS